MMYLFMENAQEETLPLTFTSTAEAFHFLIA